MLTQNRRLTGILLGALLLLMVPLVAMQFTNEVDWSFSDFVIMGILLLVTGLTCEMVMRIVKNNVKRLIVIQVILLIFFLVWAELAVGIFGTPFAGS
jgi:hypothetical protein